MKEFTLNVVYWLLLVAFCILPCLGISQDYSQDIVKITARFNKGDASYRMKYCFYPYDSVKKASDSMNADCYISGQDYYFRINSGEKLFEYYRNSKYYFVIDHTQKAVMVKNNSESQQQLWDMSKVDSLIHVPGVKITYKELDNNHGQYEISIPGGTWNRFRLVFDHNTYSLEKMYMYSSYSGMLSGTMCKKPRVGIYYSSYSEKQLDKNIFSEAKVFSDTHSSIVLTNSYGKYKLLDYIYKLTNRKA